jgi:hypothetical protein
MTTSPRLPISGRMRSKGWRKVAWLLLGMAVAAPAAAQARTATEALAKGQSYVLPAMTYCAGQDALDALVELRHAGDLDRLPPGCFSPNDAQFAIAFKGFIPDHKVAGLKVPEKLSHPNRFGQNKCTDAGTGASINCDIHVIRSGFVAGTLVGANGAKVPAFIEVAYGIEVIDPRSGDLQFAPLAAQKPTSAR